MKSATFCGITALVLTTACAEVIPSGPTIKERAQIGFTSGGWDQNRIASRRCFEIFPNFFEVVGEMKTMTQVAQYFTRNGIPADPTAPASVGDIAESNPAPVKITYYGISSMFGDMDPHDMEVAACFLDGS